MLRPTVAVLLGGGELLEILDNLRRVQVKSFGGAVLVYLFLHGEYVEARLEYVVVVGGVRRHGLELAGSGRVTLRLFALGRGREKRLELGL